MQVEKITVVDGGWLEMVLDSRHKALEGRIRLKRRRKLVSLVGKRNGWVEISYNSRFGEVYQKGFVGRLCVSCRNMGRGGTEHGKGIESKTTEDVGEDRETLTCLRCDSDWPRDSASRRNIQLILKALVSMV